MIRRYRTHHSRAYRLATGHGYTLVEVVVVILILGILGSVAAPKIINTTQVASQNAFMSQLTSYADAFDLYKIEHGDYPSDSLVGILPSGMEAYLSPAEFALETPIGGRWDFGLSSNIVIGVEYANGTDFPGNAVMLEIDQQMDDGNLATGALILVDATHKWLYWRFGER